jgi:hypothetical protein
MTLTEELTERAQIAAYRQSCLDPALRAAGLRDEAELLEITGILDEHPEGYEGPCLCEVCRSYAV